VRNLGFPRKHSGPWPKRNHLRSRSLFPLLSGLRGINRTNHHSSLPRRRRRRHRRHCRRRRWQITVNSSEGARASSPTHIYIYIYIYTLEGIERSRTRAVLPWLALPCTVNLAKVAHGSRLARVCGRALSFSRGRGDERRPALFPAGYRCLGHDLKIARAGWCARHE